MHVTSAPSLHILLGGERYWPLHFLLHLMSGYKYGTWRTHLLHSKWAREEVTQRAGVISEVRCDCIGVVYVKPCACWDVQLNPSARDCRHGCFQDFWWAFFPPSNEQESKDNHANKQWGTWSDSASSWWSVICLSILSPDSLELAKHDWLLVWPEQHVAIKK